MHECYWLMLSHFGVFTQIFNLTGIVIKFKSRDRFIILIIIIATIFLKKGQFPFTTTKHREH